MSFADDIASLHLELFQEFGVQALLVTRNGDEIATRALLDEVTRNNGDLSGMVDSRPSVRLPVVDVGHKPRGLLTLSGRTFELDRNVDGDNDAHVVRVYAREQLDT